MQTARRQVTPRSLRPLPAPLPGRQHYIFRACHHVHVTHRSRVLLDVCTVCNAPWTAIAETVGRTSLYGDQQ